MLCSAANVGNARDIEQLLGRVLRMPYAKARVAQELNKAYAHVASETFFRAAQSLRDSLEEMGFDPAEAEAAVQNPAGELPLFDAAPVLELTVQAVPALRGLPESEARAVEVTEHGGGGTTVRVEGPVSAALEEALLQEVAAVDRPQVCARVREHNAEIVPSPAQRGVRFAVPVLTVEDETGQRVLFDADVVRENAPVNLLEYPADVHGLDYDASTRRYVLDLHGETLELELMGSEDLRLSLGKTEMTEVDLVAWLHPKLRDMAMTQTMVSAWALQAVRSWLEKPEMTLAVADRGRFILLRRLQEAIARAKEDVAAKAYQAMLFGPDSTVLADAEYSFRFPESYTPGYVCKGVRFRKHYYRQVGEMK